MVTPPIDRRRAFDLFDEALQRDANGRDEFIEAQCAGDAALQSEVRALLAVVERDTRSMSALTTAASSASESLVGREFGRFRLVERIGEGGMGVVYRAERTDGVPQAVALKVVAGHLSSTAYLRFEREAQMLARLEHPAVARLIDTGTQEGRTWIAMEYVQGQPIDRYCDSHHLTLRERVELLVVLADAIAAAHRMLVVHRDIKPANVLVNDQGRPKLIDFGIGATLTAVDGSHAPTADVGRLFTPNYSAPEQVTGEPVTVATDIFGLGAGSSRFT
jgi:serine/threonine protein kinase